MADRALKLKGRRMSSRAWWGAWGLYVIANILYGIGFTKAWGLDGLIVVNLFALRATDPAGLLGHRTPVGNPANDQFIREAIGPWSVVVAAWGAHKIAAARGQAVMDMIAAKGVSVGCLGVTKARCPRHPLYVPASQALESYGGTGDPLSIEVPA